MKPPRNHRGEGKGCYVTSLAQTPRGRHARRLKGVVLRLIIPKYLDKTKCGVQARGEVTLKTKDHSIL